MTEKQMLPDVAAYLAEKQAAFDAWEKIYQDLEAMYPDRRSDGTDEQQAQDQAYVCQFLEYHARYVKAKKAAWERLAGSSDPLIAWVGRYCTDYRGDAVIALSELPASLNELDALAKEHDWCDAWDAWDSDDPDAEDFRWQLIKEGFFSEDRPDVPYTGRV